MRASPPAFLKATDFKIGMRVRSTLSHHRHLYGTVVGYSTDSCLIQVLWNDTRIGGEFSPGHLEPFDGLEVILGEVV